ncbi:MAG: hypothetical protein LBI27_06115 [Clostridiales bacterium]|jgi:hypothetical protein|nr:hypothetical protein [Clostridiales bacterium]
MDVRMMAQNQLMASGFDWRSSSVPPAWTSKGNEGLANRPQDNSVSSSNATLRSAGAGIQSVVAGMQGNKNAFSAVEGRSSHTDVATVSVDNSRANASLLRDTAIDVKQAATAQANAGDAVSASGRDIASGDYRFSVETGGKTYDFNIKVAAGESNEAVQRKMAEAVNARKIGVTASVSTTKDGNDTASRLTLTAANTGTGSTFTVTDRTGNLASDMGITSVSTQAQNAVYSVNGGLERTSESNQINIASGVTATLRGAGTTDITFARSTDQQVSAVKNLVNSLNSALRNTKTTDGRGSERFASDIIGMNITFAPSLSRVGINVQDNGQLSVDENKLQQAASDGSLAKMFENTTSGFAARANRVSANAASGGYRNSPTPVDYTSQLTNFNFGNTGDMWSWMSFLG